MHDLSQEWRKDNNFSLTSTEQTPAYADLLFSFALRPARFDAHFDPRSDHLRFYTRRSLARLLRDFRFESIDVREAGGAIPGARRLLLASARRSRF